MQSNNPEIYQPVSLTAVNLLVAQPSASPHLEDEDDDYHLNDDVINMTPSTLLDVDDDQVGVVAGGGNGGLHT